MPRQTAKLFASGRSHKSSAYPRKPASSGAEVRIRRHGNAVILEPLETAWDWLPAQATPLDQDFIQAALELQPQQHRPALATL